MADSVASAARERRAAAQEPSSVVSRSHAPMSVGMDRSLTLPAVLRSSLESRAIGTTEVREWLHLEGTASLTDTPYEMWDAFGPYMERVDAAAFSASLARNPDVAFLVNHKGLTMARTAARTLELRAPLDMEAWLNPARSDVNDLRHAIDDGCIDQMSFAAILKEGEWNEDYTEFVMLELDLHGGDVSAVNFGANPHTSISARALRMVDEADRLPEGVARSMLRRLEARFDVNSSKVTAAEANGRSLSIVRSALLADIDDD